jgi:hypothetical protein
VLEGHAALYQLADAIYGKAPARLQEARVKEADNIVKNAAILAERLRVKDVDAGLVESFEEVAASMKHWIGPYRSPVYWADRLPS